MLKKDVFSLCRELDNLGVRYWFDGGWGVDVLLREQTRDHDDLDIVVEKKDVGQIVDFFREKGYSDVMRDNTSDWNFVMGDEQNLVDIHVIEIDEEGNGIYGPAERGVYYPSDSLLGEGEIDGYKISCLTAQYQIKSHTGYELDEKDYHDVKLLCNRFGLKMPIDYDEFFD